MLGDGQVLMSEMHHVITRRQQNSNVDKFQLKFIDVGAVLDGYARWNRIFDETISGRATNGAAVTKAGG